MQTLTTLEMLRNAMALSRESGASMALVPTMGALHEGHLTLVREAQKRADRVTVSIFVNPTQFGEGEDLDAYPRQLAEDSAKLAAEGVDFIWAPPVEQMYPDGYATNISVSRLGANFCGANRPGHFDGVATIVCKLFHQVLPDMAFFGEKDFQQLAIIRRMARDLDLTRPFADAIYGALTVREADGLAMSSRNRYLSKEQRQQAAALPAAMKQAAKQLRGGGLAKPILDQVKSGLIDAGFDSIDYIALADEGDLTIIDQLQSAPARLLIAARIGKTRLIDNIAVNS